MFIDKGLWMSERFMFVRAAGSTGNRIGEWLRKEVSGVREYGCVGRFGVTIVGVDIDPDI